MRTSLKWIKDLVPGIEDLLVRKNLYRSSQVHQTFLKALLFRLSLQAEKLPAVMTAAPLRKRASRSKRANSAVYQVTV